MDNKIYRIEPVPGGLEATWGIVFGPKPAEYIDWITDEIKPEQVVQIICTDADRLNLKNNPGISHGGG